jgi:hypothetical protein
MVDRSWASAAQTLTAKGPISVHETSGQARGMYSESHALMARKISWRSWWKSCSSSLGEEAADVPDISFDHLRAMARALRLYC